MPCSRCGRDDVAQDLCPDCAAMSIPMPPLIPPTPVLNPSAMPILVYGDLEHATTYLGVARTLRGIGIGQIIWGIFVLGLGLLFALALNDLDMTVRLIVGTMYFAFGVAFITEGIWFVVAPSAAGLLVAAITMFVTALLFVLGMFSIIGIATLIVLIVYGISLIRIYKKYGPLMAQRPNELMLTQAASLLDTLMKGKIKRVPELFEFCVTSFATRRYWRGLLLNNMAVFIALDARLIGRSIAEVFILSPAGIEIEVNFPKRIPRQVKGVLFLNDQHMTGSMPLVCYQRFLDWQSRRQPQIPPAPTVP